MNPLSRFKNWLTNLPNKKHHVEFLTAILSVPVLLTVVYMNFLSIQEKRTSDKITPTPTTQPSSVTIIKERDTPSPQPKVTLEPSTEACKPGIGSIDIVSPEDNDSLSTNPLDIDITYAKDGYCAVVWSYKIDNGSWSDYTDRDIVIYNLPSGQKKLSLRVKSIVTGEEKTLERSFNYTNTQAVPTPTAVPPTSTPPPTATPTPTVHP